MSTHPKLRHKLSLPFRCPTRHERTAVCTACDLQVYGDTEDHGVCPVAANAVAEENARLRERLAAWQQQVRDEFGLDEDAPVDFEDIPQLVRAHVVEREIQLRASLATRP